MRPRVFVQIVRQILLIGHHAVDKGNELPLVQQQPEMIVIRLQPRLQRLLCCGLRRREAFCLNLRNRVQIGKLRCSDFHGIIHPHVLEIQKRKSLETNLKALLGRG